MTETDAIEGLREWFGRDAGDIGPMARPFDFLILEALGTLRALGALGLVLALELGARGFTIVRVYLHAQGQARTKLRGFMEEEFELNMFRGDPLVRRNGATAQGGGSTGEGLNR